MIFELLEEGKENSKKTTDLMKYLNVGEREIRQIVSIERKNGHVILSDVEKGGYYLPGSQAEIKAFIHLMNNRIGEMQKATESAKKALVDDNLMTS